MPSEEFDDQPWVKEALADARAIYRGQYVSATVPTLEHVRNSARDVFEHVYPNPVEPEYHDADYTQWAQSVVRAALFHQEHNQQTRVDEALADDPDARRIIEELRGMRSSEESPRDYAKRAIDERNRHAQAAMLIRMASINQTLEEGREPDYLTGIAQDCQSQYVPIARALGLGRLAGQLDDSSMRLLLDARKIQLPGKTRDETEDLYINTDDQLERLKPLIRTARRNLTHTMSRVLREAGVRAYLRDENNAIVGAIGAGEDASMHADFYVREKTLASILRKRVRYEHEGLPHEVADLPDLLSGRLVLRYKRDGERLVPATMQDVAGIINEQLYPWVARQNERYPRSAVSRRAGAPEGQLIQLELEGFVPRQDARHFDPPAEHRSLVHPLAINGPKPNGYRNVHVRFKYNYPENTLPMMEMHFTTLANHVDNELGPASHAGYKLGERGLVIRPDEGMGTFRRPTDRLFRIFFHRGRAVHEILFHHNPADRTTLRQALTRYGMPPLSGMQYNWNRDPANPQARVQRIGLETHLAEEHHGMHVYEKPARR